MNTISIVYLLVITEGSLEKNVSWAIGRSCISCHLHGSGGMVSMDSGLIWAVGTGFPWCWGITFIGWLTGKLPSHVKLGCVGQDKTRYWPLLVVLLLGRLLCCRTNNGYGCCCCRCLVVSDSFSLLQGLTKRQLSLLVWFPSRFCTFCIASPCW